MTAFACWAQAGGPGVRLADTGQRTLMAAKIGQRYELLVLLPEGYAKPGA